MKKSLILASVLAATSLTLAAPPQWAGQPSPFAVAKTCDINKNGQVDLQDLLLIRGAIGITPLPGDPRDANGDGVINIADARFCQLRCTKAACAV